MLAVDPSQNAITFAYNFTPSEKFLGTDRDYEETSQDIKYHTLFTFGSLTIPQFSRGSEAYGVQNRFSNAMTASGIYAFYPTDEYTLRNVAVSCRFANATDESNYDEYVLTPRTSLAIAPRCAFGLNVRSNIPTTFSIDVSDTTGISVKNAADGASYDLFITIARPFMFRLYPGFVIFAFWLIIVFELLLIFTLSFFEFRKVRPCPVRAALRKLIFFYFHDIPTLSTFPSAGRVCECCDVQWSHLRLTILPQLHAACPSFWFPVRLDFVFLGGKFCSYRSFHNGMQVRYIRYLGPKLIVATWLTPPIARYMIEQPASKSSGVSWLKDVFCPPIPPRPDSVAPVAPEVLSKSP
jgi:hypothetical protein